MVVGVNWLTLYQEYCRVVIWARYCPSWTLASFFSILVNKLIGYAYDSTLMAVVPSPGVRVTVAASLIRDLSRVCEWCDLWGMKFNPAYLAIFLHGFTSGWGKTPQW